jgi:GT2 family glycosyltransferase
MNSAIAILTYRRVEALRLMLGQVTQHCPGVPVAVFEDCGQLDDTEAFLLENSEFVRRDMELEADVYRRGAVEVFLAHANVGVTGESNKAIKWFLGHQECDHLCLCNDDLMVTGPFHETYAAAHEKLGVGLLCFTDFDSPQYAVTVVKVRGLKVKLMTRMTGIMMSMTRALVDAIGYYDADAFDFGQEHCDYTNRARLSGFIDLNGQPQHCLDVECPHLHHQDIPSSLDDDEKQKFNTAADAAIQEVGAQYSVTSRYRPFSTGGWAKTVAGRDGIGTPLREFPRYGRIKSSRLSGASPLKPTVRQVVDLGVDSIGPVSDSLG